MESNYCCPTCKKSVKEKEDHVTCESCNKDYFLNEECIIFPNYSKFCESEKNSKTFLKLMDLIELKGYDEAVYSFIKKNPDTKPFIINTNFDQSVDGIFHCLGEKNQRCLTIGANLGNIPEILSHIFEQVYSIDSLDERIKFQNIRFRKNCVKNIKTLKCNIFQLPFKDNFFDFINCNGIFNILTYFNNFKNIDEGQKELLKELKRVLSPGGVLLFGIKNNQSSRIFSDRKLTNSIFDKDEPQVLNRNLSNYEEIVKKNGLKFRTFWVAPSYDRPYFSGNTNDSSSLEWYIHNLGKFVKDKKLNSKRKIMIKIPKLLRGNSINFFLMHKMPAYLLCCYKEKISKSMENLINEKTGYERFLVSSRREKTIYILLDRNKKPKKIVHFKRYGKDFPNEILDFKRTFQNLENPKNRAWMEDWANGQLLNPGKKDEVFAAFKWLFTFQKNTDRGEYSEADISKEITMILTSLKGKGDLDIQQYQKWLEEYRNFMLKNSLKKTAVHGDFWFGNILIESKSLTTNVIDWEYFQNEGNPLYDLMTYILRWMMMSSESPDHLEIFRRNLNQKGQFLSILKELREVIDSHYSFCFNLNVLLRFIILHRMAKSKLKADGLVIYIKMLEVLSKN